MNKKLTAFLIYLLSLTLARGADIGSTYLLSPNLEKEGNPFQLFLGSWPALLMVQAIAFLVILGLIALYCFGKSHRSQQPDPTTLEYASECIYGHSHGTRRRLFSTFLLCWPLPKNWLQYFRMISFVLANVVIAGSFLAALCWWLLHGWRIDWFNRLYGGATVFGFPGGGIFLSFILVMIAVSAMLYYRIELRRQAREGQESSQLNHHGASATP